jgi:hypothetical protein
MHRHAEPLSDLALARPVGYGFLAAALLAHTLRGAALGAARGALFGLLAVLLAGAIMGLLFAGLLGFVVGPLYAAMCWGIGAAGWGALGGAVGGGLGTFAGWLVVTFGCRPRFGGTCAAVIGSIAGAATMLVLTHFQHGDPTDAWVLIVTGCGAPLGGATAAWKCVNPIRQDEWFVTTTLPAPDWTPAPVPACARHARPKGILSPECLAVKSPGAQRRCSTW